MRCSFHGDLALKIIDQSGRNLHQGRFAGSVLSHQRVDLAGAQVKVHFPQHRDRPETLGDPSHLQSQVIRRFGLFGWGKHRIQSNDPLWK